MSERPIQFADPPRVPAHAQLPLPPADPIPPMPPVPTPPASPDGDPVPVRDPDPSEDTPLPGEVPPLPAGDPPEDAPVRMRRALPPEVGGPIGPEPTRYGDWERKGRCSDF